MGGGMSFAATRLLQFGVSPIPQFVPWRSSELTHSLLTELTQ